MSARRRPRFTDLAGFADALGVEESTLRRYVFHADRHYKLFRIAKRGSGGYRAIAAPSRALKGIQRWIDVFILRDFPPRDAAMAFRRGRSIVDNAGRHVGQRFVLNLDLRDFFPSITVGRVFGVFRKLGYPKTVAFALGRLTTLKGSLPQGAPTSPAIANLVARSLDDKLWAICRERGLRYTRYCDDISISGKWISDQGEVRVLQAIREAGFEVNRRKIRRARRNSCQLVTGLVVNEKVGLPRHRRKMLRALFHQAKLEPSRFVERANELVGHLGLLRMTGAPTQTIDRYRATIRGVSLARDQAGET